MTSLPARELLESVHTFPGQFVFKAVGRAEGDFVTRVVECVRKALDLDFDPPFESRETPAGRHVAVTVTPWVESSEDVLIIYDRIRELSGIVMVM